MDSYQVLEYQEIDSTNEEAKRLIKKGIAQDLLVWSHSQTRGKGRYDREWISDVGNLFFSIVKRMDKLPIKVSFIPFVTSLAVYNAIEEFIEEQSGVNLKIKWPNDILLNEKKISGILIESKGLNSDGLAQFIVVGVGVNISSHPDKTIFPSSSLEESLKCEINRQILMENIVRHFDKLIEQVLSYGFSFVKESWIKNAYKFQKRVTVNLNGKDILDGVFLGIDDDGALILLKDSGEKQIVNYGDVFV